MAATVLDARSLFEKRRRLAQVSPKLIDVIVTMLNEIYDPEFNEKFLRDALARVMTCKEWPVFKLDEIEFEIFSLQLKRLSAFSRRRRNDALRSSTQHFTRSIYWNPMSVVHKRPYKDLIVGETYHAFRYAVGMLTLAWQVHEQQGDEELIMGYEAFNRRYPSKPKSPPNKRSPRSR